MREFLTISLTIVIAVNVMVGCIAFVLNSIDIMNWPWIARLVLVIYGFYVAYQLNKIKWEGQ